MRRRLTAQIAARRKQQVPADLEAMDANFLAMLDAQVGDLEHRIKGAIGQGFVALFVMKSDLPLSQTSSAPANGLGRAE